MISFLKFNFSFKKESNSLNSELLNEQDEIGASSIELDKKAIDKMRFYGGLGKRIPQNEM